MPSASRKTLVLLGASIGLIAIIARFYLLDRQSLWYDEGYSMFYSGGTLGDTFYRLAHSWGSEHVEQLYYLLLHGWRAVFGSSEWALRSLSGVFGVAAVILLYFAGKQLGGQKHGLLAAAFGAVSAWLVLYSRDVRPYSLLACIALVQLWLLLLIREGRQILEGRQQAWLRVAFWLSFAVSLYASVLFSSFSAALFLADLPRGLRQKRVLGTWVGSVLAAIAGGLASILQPGGPGNITTLRLPLIQHAAFSLYGTLVGTTLGPPLEALRGPGLFAVFTNYWPALIGFGVMAVAFAVAIVATATQSSSPAASSGPRFLAGVFVGSYVLAGGFAVLTNLNWQPRHSFFLAVLACLMLPYGVTTVGSGSRLAGWIAACLYVGLNLTAIYHHYFDSAYAEDDYRSAAHYVQQHPGVPSILMWGNPDLLRYYGDTTTLDGREMVKQTAAAIREATSGAPRVMVVVNRDFYWGGPEPLDVALRRNYAIDSVVTFPYFKIYDAELLGARRQNGPGSR